MIGKTHRVGGLAVGAAASAALFSTQDMSMALPMTIVVLTGSAFGSLIPDLDHKGAELSKDAKLASWLVRQFADHRGLTHYGITALIFFIAMIGLNFLLVSVGSPTFVAICGALIVQSAIALVFEFLPRRMVRKYGLKIRLIALVVSLVISFNVPYIITDIITFYSIGLGLGYLSHLLLDSLTVSGIPLFGANRDNVRLATLRTGESERLVANICYLITGIFLIIIVL